MIVDPEGSAFAICTHSYPSLKLEDSNSITYMILSVVAGVKPAVVTVVAYSVNISLPAAPAPTSHL